MRKPNYGFERDQRNKAKEAKAAAKAQKKQDQRAAASALRPVSPEDEARGGPEAAEKPTRQLDD